MISRWIAVYFSNREREETGNTWQKGIYVVFKPVFLVVTLHTMTLILSLMGTGHW